MSARRLLIALALLFLSLFLFVPLVSVFFEAFKKGWEVYVAAITEPDAIAAINYLVDLKVNHGVNLRVINNSWGGTSFSQSLLDAINAAGDAGILFVVAAGNDAANHGTASHYPSDYQCTNGGTRGWDCVVSVAATDTTGNLASYSDFGATAVDLGAPGSGIVSTLPGSRYGSMSGTSMAAPHVTGSLALLKAKFPGEGYRQLINRLLRGVDQGPRFASKAEAA